MSNVHPPESTDASETPVVTDDVTEVATRLLAENEKLRRRVAYQVEEMKNRGDGIDSLVHTMGVLKKHLGATEGETVRHLISRLEETEVGTPTDDATEQTEADYLRAENEKLKGEVVLLRRRLRVAIAQANNVIGAVNSIQAVAKLALDHHYGKEDEYWEYVAKRQESRSA